MPMLMSSSCTLLRGPPAPALQLRKQTETAAPSSVAALPRAPFKVSRAPRLVCHASKYTYDIQPSALVRPSVEDHDAWKIHEDKDHITLWFLVGDAPIEADKLGITTSTNVEGQGFLHIKYRGDNHPASQLDVSLLMPQGYGGNKITNNAYILREGWLLIVITKPKQQLTNIPVNKEEPIKTKPADTPN